MAAQALARDESEEDYDDVLIEEDEDADGDAGYVLDSDSGSGDADSDLDTGVPDADGGDIFELLNSGFFGSFGGDVGVGSVDRDENLDQSLPDLEEFVYTPLSPFSDPRKRRGAKHRAEIQTTIDIGPEDFEEGPQRSAFLYVFERMRACILKSTSAENLDEAVRWIFNGDKEGITFELCCRVLGVRPEILRLRLQYHFYLAWSKFPTPFGLKLVAPLPDLLEGEILYRGGEEGFELAMLIWSWPGIERSQLWKIITRRYSEDRYLRSLELLEDRGVIGMQGMNYYLIGRNPSLLSPTSRQMFRWSELWK